jgi:transitional endoplasmic reticulum ATPase
MTSLDVAPSWDALILPDATITRLQSLCEMLRNAAALRAHALEIPRVLLSGPPGTGKSLIARTLASESGRAFVVAGPSELRVGYIGQSGRRVRDVFERARSVAPSILFLDEIEWSAAARGSRRSDHVTDEIVTELLVQFVGLRSASSEVCVLAATIDPTQIDTAVRLRHALHIEIPKPGLEERRRMITTFIGTHHADFDIESTANELATLSQGMCGRDLKALVQQALQRAVERAINDGTLDQLALTRTDLFGPLSMSPR